MNFRPSFRRRLALLLQTAYLKDSSASVSGFRLMTHDELVWPELSRLANEATAKLLTSAGDVGENLFHESVIKACDSIRAFLPKDGTAPSTLHIEPIQTDRMFNEGAYLGQIDFEPLSIYFLVLEQHRLVYAIAVALRNGSSADDLEIIGSAQRAARIFLKKQLRLNG